MSAACFARADGCAACDNSTASNKAFQRCVPDRAADILYHHIDSTPLRQVHDLLGYSVRRCVDRRVGAKSRRAAELLCTTGRDQNTRTGGFGDLQRRQ